MYSDRMQSNDGATTASRPESAEPLRELTRGALRRALAGEDGRRDAALDLEVRRMVRWACESARERGLHAEQLLILVKQTWRELPEARGLSRYDAEAALAGVISLCIDEYYRQVRQA